jgi:hypothetical protein
VTTTVVGKDRKVAVVLIDPSGTAIDGTELRPKAARAKFEEVSATGTYRLVVVSDRIGAFTLKVTGPPAPEADAAKLRKEIKELKALLAKKEEQLKALEAKKKP